MKQHHLSLKGIDQSIAIETRRLAEQVSPRIPATITKPLIYAVADILTGLSGDAMEAHVMTDDELRQLFSEMRVVIGRRKQRPKVSELQRQILHALGRAPEPLTLAQLSAQLFLPRTTVNTAIYACMKRLLIHRELRGTKGHYSLTEGAKEFRDQPPELSIPPGALVANPRVATPPAPKAAPGPLGPRLKSCG